MVNQRMLLGFETWTNDEANIVAPTLTSRAACYAQEGKAIMT